MNKDILLTIILTVSLIGILIGFRFIDSQTNFLQHISGEVYNLLLE